MKDIPYASVRGGYFGAVTLMGILAFLRVAVMVRRAATWLDWLDIAAMSIGVILIWVSSLQHLRTLNRLDGKLENRTLVRLCTNAYTMAFFGYMLLFMAAHALR